MSKRTNVYEAIIDISPLTNEWKKDGWSEEKISSGKADVSRLTMSSILYECEGFYRIFKALLPKCFFVFPQSKDEYEIYKENDKLFDALVVNGAFAAELAMKYLYFRANGNSFKTLRGHDLFELYQMIPDSDRSVISVRLEEGKHSDEKSSVNELINDLRNHFIDYRYSYERVEGKGINIFFKTFVCSLCDYAISLKDD